MSKREISKLILVVDDEADIREYLGAVLEDAGFEVVTASDGDRALELVRARPPDLISLDLVMPRKSGIKLMFELRRNKRWSLIPELIVTGHAQDELGGRDLEQIMASKALSGPRSYLEKPVSPRSYVAAVRRELGLEVAESAVQTDRLTQLKAELNELIAQADEQALEQLMSRLKE